MEEQITELQDRVSTLEAEVKELMYVTKELWMAIDKKNQEIKELNQFIDVL